jgi:hypothetical protein
MEGPYSAGRRFVGKGPDGYLYEPVWLHPSDAFARKIQQGDIGKVFNMLNATIGQMIE